MAFFDFVSKTSYTFEGKKAEEKVILFLHRHWFTLVHKLIIVCLSSLLPFVFLLVLGSYILPYLSIFIFFWSAFILILWFVIFYIITMYLLDYWIVTNERIVDSEQTGFFNRKVAELSLSTVQDVSVTLKGFIPTTMNFGSVIIQTAARENHFYFDQVPNPQTVKDTIMDLIDDIEDRKEHQHHTERSPRTEISRL
jgi:uncharacterized membrane protein YdbT with pleckstrin-like domain